jgi:thiol-disulfide isomerase/thioredoxin
MDQPVSRARRPLVAAGLIAVLAAAVAAGLLTRPPAADAQPAPAKDTRIDAPEFDGGVAWINSAGPVKLKDLKGKVVLLDFWTLCCINCIHVMPDLAKLEKKYPNELVVIGVHSAKFENEKDTRSIRQAVLRYELAHPVVNDANHAIWNAYEVNSWPSFVLIDPEGKFYGRTGGEGNYDTLDHHIGKLVKEHRAKGTLSEKPVRFDLLRYRDHGDTPLFFPGKVLADGPGNRLFIADSTHHRLVVTDLNGAKQAVIGTGTPGRKDGRYEEAQFDDPQGMALDGDTLYVADRKNHCVRAVDLKAKAVTTVAGTGTQDGDFGNRQLDTWVSAAATGLNSPWDLLLHGRRLFIAMAGHHQIWVMDLDAKRMKPFAGNGREHIKDGPPYAASFAQPSGLTTDGTSLFVADSEGSAIRKLPLDGEGRVTTLVGRPGEAGALFYFGDADGTGDAVKLQHALGVLYLDGKLYVADTYNDKLKVLDPATRECRTLVGGDDAASFFGGPVLSEPAGLSHANGKLYVADTNASRIRVVDLKTKAVETLTLTGVEPPPPQKDWQPPVGGK